MQQRINTNKIQHAGISRQGVWKAAWLAPRHLLPLRGEFHSIFPEFSACQNDNTRSCREQWHAITTPHLLSNFIPPKIQAHKNTRKPSYRILQLGPGLKQVFLCLFPRCQLLVAQGKSTVFDLRWALSHGGLLGAFLTQQRSEHVDGWDTAKEQPDGLMITGRLQVNLMSRKIKMVDLRYLDPWQGEFTHVSNFIFKTTSQTLHGHIFSCKDRQTLTQDKNETSLRNIRSYRNIAAPQINPRLILGTRSFSEPPRKHQTKFKETNSC